MKTWIVMVAFTLSGISPLWCVPLDKNSEEISLFFRDSHTLDEYLVFMLRHNPDFARLKEEGMAWHSLVPSEEALPDPSLRLGLFLSEVETRIGPQQQKLSIRQKIPWKGKRGLKGDIAASRGRQIDARLAVLKREYTAKFKKAYGNLFYLGMEIKNSQEHLGILKDFERVLLSKYESGLASYANLIRIQLEQDRLIDRIDELKKRHEPLSARLFDLMGVATAISASQSPSPLIPFPLELPIKRKLLQRGRKIHNPRLTEISHQIHREKTILELEKLKSRPDFQFGLDWIRIGGADMADTPGSGRDALSISAGINIPIWKKKYSALAKSASHRIASSENELIRRKNRLTAELSSAFFDLEDAFRKEKLYRDQILPKAEETLKILLSNFESDQASYLDVLDAEKTLLEFGLTREKIKSDMFIAQAEIERITDQETK